MGQLFRRLFVYVSVREIERMKERERWEHAKNEYPYFVTVFCAVSLLLLEYFSFCIIFFIVHSVVLIRSLLFLSATADMNEQRKKHSCCRWSVYCRAISTWCVCVCVLWRLPHESPVWIAANVPCSPFKCTTCGPHIVLLPLLLCRTGVGKIISLHIYSLFLLSSKHRKQKQNDFFSAIRCRLSNHSPPQHNRYVPT